MLKCHICNSDHVILFHDKVFGMGEAKVFKCENCKTIFLFPYLTNSEIGKLYQNYNEMYILRGVRKNIPSSYEVFEIGLNEGKLRYKRFQNHIKNKDVLEIGAGAGSFLYCSKNIAKEIHAVEPCESNRKYIKEQITSNSYEDINHLIQENVKFDAIFLFHVFEHMTSPISFLKKIKLLLKEDGCLIIEVPNADDALIGLYDIKEFKNFYFQIQHPFYYNEHSLRYIFKIDNYDINKVIYHQRYGIDNHLNWLKNKTQGGDLVFKEFFADFDNNYRDYLIRNKKSDTISVILNLAAYPASV